MPQFVSTQIGKGTVLQAPTADGTVGQFLKTDGAGNLSFDTVAASPSGSDTQIQFNDGGSFGGAAGFTFTDDGTTHVLGVGYTASRGGKIQLGTLSNNYISATTGGSLRLNSATNFFEMSGEIKTSSLQMSNGFVGIQASGTGVNSTLKLNANTASNTIATIKPHGLHVTGEVTTEPVSIITMPASHTANAFEVQDSTGAVRGYLDVSPGNPKFMMLDFYGDEIAIEGAARSVKISHKNAIMATASSYGGSGGITKTFYFDNIAFKNGINGLADRQQYVACGIRNVVDSVPTATGYSNRHTNVTVQRDDTLLMCTPSMTALNNERNDSGHLMLATGNASIAGTATEANGGSVYIALGAKAGSGSDGKFIVRTLAGVDHFWVDLDNNAVVTGSDGSSATGGTMRSGHGVGTDIAGANLKIAAGEGTGTGAGGHLIFQTAAAGGSGSSLNSLATMLELTDDSKIGFFAATPVVQQAGTGETTGFTAGAGTAVNDDSTFTGNVGTAAYRISDIVKALKNYGLLASS